jgi:CDP-diacylglycerol---glycerol-3-phosphate 3-phosphatidyltransferase
MSSAKSRQRRASGVLLKEFWNIPNMITVGRMFMIPIFVWLTYDADPLSSMFAALLFAVASILDVVDGYLARKWNLVTVVGKLLDPLADKLMVLAALVMLVRLGRVAAWMVILVLAREFIVTALRSIAATEGMVIEAGQEGKWKTSTQLIAIIALCLHYVHPLNLIWVTYPVDYNRVGVVLLYVSMGLSLWSAGVYFRNFLRMLAKHGSSSAGEGMGA